MSRTYLGHSIVPVKNEEYILLSDYEQLQDKIVEMKQLLEQLLKTNVVVINGKAYYKQDGDNAITQMLLDVLERGKE